MARTIEIEDMITVGTLAEKLMLPATRLIGELMKNGVMATINERIDFDTADIIVSDLGLDVELVKKAKEEPKIYHKKQLNSDTATVRPPVIAMMGHVDHGKTSLLDAIRTAQVAKGEAGGITQHISAYQIAHNGRNITFLDTPGHEAFAAIRQHGALLTDIAVIVVAADDGIKPQTLEAIRYARQAGVKIIVALNKIDKEGADPNRVKQQLAEQQLLPEEWGGDTVIVEVSAKTKQGIDALLDMILLVADVEDFRADVDGVAATGLIIESHLEQGKGPIAKALVTAGRLKSTDCIVAGATYAKIRRLELPDGSALKEATPSTPVVITGFKALPRFGDEFVVVADEKAARLIAEKAGIDARGSADRGDMTSSELIRMINRDRQVQYLNVIIKADVRGSLASVNDSLRALDTEEVAVRIVGSGVGAITENDLHAATEGTIIYGFNVTLPQNVKRLAARDKISIRLYNVIYELIDDVKEELTHMLRPEVVETDLGRLLVKAVFKTTKSEVICGGEVVQGRLAIPALVRIMRDNTLLAEAEIINLKRGPQDVKEVLANEMCGVGIKTATRLELQPGDRLELFTRSTVARTL